MKFIYALLLIFLSHGASAAPPAGYSLRWSDEFNTLSLGPGARWAHYFVGWNVRELDGNSDDALKVRDEESWNGGPTAHEALGAAGSWGSPGRYLHEVIDGKLHLRGYPIESQPGFFWMPYLASMISGQGTFAQRYGYWETRVLLKSVTKGQHFAAWLLPTDNSWPPEIDLLEAVGQDQGTIYSNSHGAKRNGGITATRAPFANWHTIGFQWTPKVLRWSIDGTVVRQRPNYIKKPLYFLMSWEMTSNWTGPTDSTTRWPAEVLVDYVRIYRPA